MVGEKVGSGVVERGLSEETEGKDRTEGVGEFLNYHCVIKSNNA